MKTLIIPVITIPVCLFFLACCNSNSKENAEPNKEVKLEFYLDKKMDVLVSEFGSPDRIESARNYQAKFQQGKTSVVMIYESLDYLVFLGEDATILGITEIEKSAH